MTGNKITPMTTELFHFVEQHSFMSHPILDQVARETAMRPDAIMQIPRHQAGFMHMLVKLLQVREAIEVGCFTGYSAIAVGSALPQNGHLRTFDIDPSTAQIARSYFDRAQLSSKIEVVVGDARTTLKQYIDHRGSGFLDFAFVDADKVNYDSYYELCLMALKSNGIMLVDNAFRDGDILYPERGDDGTKAVARLIEKMKADPRVESTMVPIADGLVLVRKI